MTAPDLARSGNPMRCGIHGTFTFNHRCSKCDGATMQLIGIGRCAAKPAGELEVGDVITWNYGYRYEVVSVEEVGEQSVRIVERALTDGKEFTRTLRRTRLVVA